MCSMGQLLGMDLLLHYKADKADGIRSVVASSLYWKEHGSKLGGGTDYPG